MLKVMESREKRKVETPRLPRTAKKVQSTRMESEMADLGVPVDTGDKEVSVTVVMTHWRQGSKCDSRDDALETRK